MNPLTREENTSPSVTENDQDTRPEVSKGPGTEQTCSCTPVDHPPSDRGESSSTIKVKQEDHGCEASAKTQNPNLSASEKCYFTFTLNVGTRKSDRSVFTASGELHENIYSVLTANDNFQEWMEKHLHKYIKVYEEKTIGAYINLGMPLKCLPTDAHLQISVGGTTTNKERRDQILRHCENLNIECILFQVVAIGKTRKTIVKISELHEKGSTLCIYALKGETIQEALCKDGRFRSDLDEFEWKLMEGPKHVHGKQSTVEEVSGKTLEMDISDKKRTHKTIEQKNRNVTSKIHPQDLMQSQIQDHEPETDGENEDEEHNRQNVPPPPSVGHDIAAKRRRTISRIKRYYRNSLNRKPRKQMKLSRPRPCLDMEYALNLDTQREATNLWIKNCKMLTPVKMQLYPHFCEDVHQMRKYFREERRRTKLSPSQQFSIYKKCFAKVTENSTSIATYEHRIHLSKSVGFIEWNNNGNTGNATCFVFHDGYIFTCRHVVGMMVGEGTDPSLWPDIISKCARVTFTFKELALPPPAEWFSIEPWIEVFDDALDYAILKLRDHGKGFPPGLRGQTSCLPSSGLLYLIGHPERQVKKIDECAVINLVDRIRRFSDTCFISHAYPMFTPRSFPPEAWRSSTLSYDTCFTSGSSGSPVFDASSKVVALHSVGYFYKCGAVVHGLIEFGHSIESILSDVKQKNEALYNVFVKEKNEQESSLSTDQMDPMEH
ncbi:serine protease FAM111B isoform 1-T9 [Molossus nigricans]